MDKYTASDIPRRVAAQVGGQEAARARNLYVVIDHAATGLRLRPGASAVLLIEKLCRCDEALKQTSASFDGRTGAGRRVERAGKRTSQKRIQTARKTDAEYVPQPDPDEDGCARAK
jgi:hypothetical protein